MFSLWVLFFGLNSFASELVTDLLPNEIANRWIQYSSEDSFDVYGRWADSNGSCTLKIRVTERPNFADLNYTKYITVDLESNDIKKKNLFVWKMKETDEKVYFKNYVPFLKYWVEDEYQQIKQIDKNWVITESFKDKSKRKTISLELNPTWFPKRLQLDEDTICELKTVSPGFTHYLISENETVPAVNLDQSAWVKYLYNTEQQINQMIYQAEHEILAAYYIVWENTDQDGKNFIANLMSAALRGVKVKLLVDGIGMGPVFSIQSETLDILKGAGVEVKVFHDKWDPVGMVNLRHRMHDKLLIADDQMLIGSSNIWWLSFNNVLKENDLWVKGSAVRDARVHFFEYWDSSDVWERPFTFSSDAYYSYIARNLKRGLSRNYKTQDAVYVPYARYVRDKIDKNEDEGTYAEVLKLIKNAKARVDIVNSYVIPTQSLTKTLNEATQNGTAVRIFTNSDEILAQEFSALAIAYDKSLPALRDTGAELWETDFQMVHGKYLVADDQWVYFGSQNLDRIAIEKNTENGIVIHDPTGDFVSSLYQDISFIRNESRIVAKDKRFQIPMPRNCKSCNFFDYILYPFIESIL
jgi:cardiolipin synthase C